MRNANLKYRTTPGNKLITAVEAVRHIKQDSTLATGGFIGSGFAEGLAIALKDRFLDEDSLSSVCTPGDLTLVYAGGQGDGCERGLNHLSLPGLLKCVIGGHWGLVPKLQQLALTNQIEAYNLPQGVMSQLFRDIAAQRPGLITKVGLGTFVDPRQAGAQINERSKRELVKLIKIDDEDFLFYKSFPIDTCFLRGTTADERGNITMEKEALTLDSLAIAMATHNSGGVVIVQVERIAKAGSLHSRHVQIPGILVDYVVLESNTSYHMQTFSEAYSAVFSGEILGPVVKEKKSPLDLRKIIARRATLALRAHDIVNLGVGIPEVIAKVAEEENISDLMTLTAEPGVIGGIPAGGLNFGASTNAEAIIDQPYQFDFYDGGGLDIAFLGLAQVDQVGNVNVSLFNSHLAGAGGFISISQNTQRVVFVGTFSAGSIKTQVVSGQLIIKSEAHITKFVQKVQQITFNGVDAVRRNQAVLYITERCVFQMTVLGLELIEIAPGIDMDKDILELMEFRPIISPHIKLMDSRIFIEKDMLIRRDLLSARQDVCGVMP